MDLAQFLGAIGAKADAKQVSDVVKNTLHNPDASPSDLVHALAVKLNKSGTQVVADGDDLVEAGIAGKVVAFLVERGDIRIEGRRIRAAGKFAEK